VEIEGDGSKKKVVVGGGGEAYLCGRRSWFVVVALCWLMLLCRLI
jgi:hypothetical protein